MKDTVTRGVTMAEARRELEKAKDAELEKTRRELEKAKHEKLEKIRLEQEQAENAELEKIRRELEKAKHEELEKTRLPFFLKIFSPGKNFILEKQKKMKDTMTRGVTMAEARLELEKAKDAELKKTRLPFFLKIFSL